MNIKPVINPTVPKPASATSTEEYKKPEKTNLKLPIFLIIGPFLISILIYAIVNFVIGSFVEAPLGDNNPTTLFGLIATGINFCIFALSFLAIPICLIIGVIILSKRLGARK